MSEGGSQWGGRGTGDTCNVVISIPGQARTDPPDKLRSPGDAVTAEDSHSGSSPQQQVERLRSPVETARELQQYQQSEKQDQQQRGRRHQQYQITPERQFSHQQVWVPHEVAQQEQQQQQSLQQQQGNATNVSPTLTLAKSAQVCDVSHNSWSSLSFSKENVDPGDSNSNSDCSEVKHRTGKTRATNNVDSFNNTSTFASISPRQSRYRRQHRVSSFDEPPSDVVSSEKDASTGSLPQSDDDLGYHNFVNGFTQQLSSGSPVECKNHAVAVSESHDKGLATQDADAAQISHSVITFQKRSSLEHSSVLNLAAGGEDNSLLKKSCSSRKKKKEKRDHCAKEKSDLSGNTYGTEANSEKRENFKEENQNDDSASLPQTTIYTKGSRRLVKRGIGMFPGSNWRRLRNTLKAANEMQSSKKQRHALNREDSFLRKFSTRNHQNVQNTSSSLDDETRRSYYSSWRLNGRFVIQHDGNFMFYWLGVITVSVLYNLWTCIAREAFREIQQGCPACWYSLDAVFDMIYILDILVQFRTGYLDQGLMVYDSKKLRQRYTRSKVIYIDFISLLPLDLLQFAIGIHPMIRFPRFFKIYRPLRFLHMLESRTAYPNLIRVANLTHILFLGAHWFAAFYYMISEAEGFTGEWSYPNPVGEFADVNRKYLRSLFWSTLTLTTIGDIPPAGNSNE